MRLAIVAACAAMTLAGCAGAPKKPASAAGVAPPPAATAATRTRAPGTFCEVAGPAQEDPSTRGDYVAGGLYKPGVRDSVPRCIPDVDSIPEPVVVSLPRSPVGNRPVYSVLDREYRVLDDTRGFVEQGIASFYGEKFHGRRTSNLEVYDMFAFTAAHKSLPLPSFARVTNLDNGKSVIVRVNDRGPFHDGRVVDLSYAAAVKLGIHQAGTGRVEVRALHPDEPQTLHASRPATPSAAPAMGAVTTTPSIAASGIDRLVAGMPPAHAGGGPSRAAASAASPATSIAPTAPTESTAPATAVPTAQAPRDYRFDMRQNGKAMSADEFDAWMKQQNVRVATGESAPPAPSQPSSAPAPTVANAAPAPSPASRSAGDAVLLQVASFSARDNAERALARLHGAGIREARVHDGEANGQKVWRVRVGPLAGAGEADVIARLSGLGFGTPHRVRE